MMSRIRRRMVADESGYVMLIVLLLLVLGLAMVMAALAETLSSNNAAGRDARVRRAQAAADAGIQAQLYSQSQADLGTTAYNFNGGVIGLSNFLDCTVPKVVTVSGNLEITGVVSTYVNTSSVCPQAWNPSSGATAFSQALGQHAAYSSEFLPGATNLLNGSTISGQNGSGERELFPKIVSIGSDTSNVPTGSGTVYSREEAILAPVAPIQAIEGENSVTISNLATALNGDVLSRGNLTTPAVLGGLLLSGSSPSGLLATLAYGGTLSGGLSVANVKQVSPSAIIQRPAVSIAASKPDCSVAANCTALGSAYNSTYDTFSMTGGTVTFQPGDYVFCSFNATGGTVNISPSASTPVRIFIDSPNSTRCAADKAHGDAQIGNFNDTAGFTNGLLGTGGVLASSGMQVYVVGNGTNDGTTVQIGPTSNLLSLNATYGAIVYAPTSKVTVEVPSLLGLGGVFDGAIVGYDTTVNALVITQDLDIGNYPLYAGVNAFRVTQYIQCSNSVTSLTGTTADLNGC